MPKIDVSNILSMFLGGVQEDSTKTKGIVSDSNATIQKVTGFNLEKLGIQKLIPIVIAMLASYTLATKQAKTETAAQKKLDKGAVDLSDMNVGTLLNSMDMGTVLSFLGMGGAAAAAAEPEPEPEPAPKKSTKKSTKKAEAEVEAEPAPKKSTKKSTKKAEPEPEPEPEPEAPAANPLIGALLGGLFGTGAQKQVVVEEEDEDEEPIATFSIADAIGDTLKESITQSIVGSITGSQPKPKATKSAGNDIAGAVVSTLIGNMLKGK